MALVVLLGFCASASLSFWWCKRFSSPALRTSLRSFTNSCEVLWDFPVSLLPAFNNKISDFLLQYPEIKYLQRQQPAHSTNHFHTRQIIQYWFHFDVQWPKSICTLITWLDVLQYNANGLRDVRTCCSSPDHPASQYGVYISLLWWEKARLRTLGVTVLLNWSSDEKNQNQ